jgi:Cu+-exporting ATPase
MNQRKIVTRSAVLGVLGAGGLLALYFLVLTAVSGGEFAISQFLEFRYFVVSLAIGFGIQIGLYGYLRITIDDSSAGKVIAVSGTTSTTAMISCCAHYLTNILPALGSVGAITLLAQYQTQLFWFGLASNAAGVFYMASRVVKFSRVHTS